MSRGLLAFAILFIVIYLGISSWRYWTVKGAYSVGKTFLLSFISAGIAFSALAVFVALF